jgi:hypothetical protein
MSSLDTQYRQALQALEAGNNQRAISLLTAVLEQDSFYVDAWVAMARALPDGDEKLDVLEQVLLLDPDNEYANEERARMLDLPSPKEVAAAAAAPPPKKMQAATKSDEIVPGIPRRWAMLAGGGLAIYTLLICGITLAVISTVNSNRSAAEIAQATSIAAQQQSAQQLSANSTATAQQFIRNSTATVQVATEQANQTATAQASITPTITPSPTVTAVGEENRVAPPPPDDLPGTILAWGGFNPSPSEGNFAEYREYDAAGDSLDAPNLDQVRGVTADVTGERIVYVWFEVRFREERIVDIAPEAEGGERFDLTDFVSLQINANEASEPSVSANGQRIAFTALAANDTREIFFYVYEGQTLIQVTSDNLNYLEVSISADGNRIAAVRQSPAGVDLVLIDVENITDPGAYPVTVLTNDGDAVIESNPALSPIGSSLAFSALPEGASQADILTLELATGEQTRLLTSENDEIEPVFSPTGRYLAYAANPLDTYNIFILDTLTSATYQLSLEASDPVFPGAWIED